uniref:AAA+ ATPase domain-containing protein n=1 Tax=Plectus sambesii TaxID=2011161 RepID=A0A914X0E7_9BILA
MTLSERLYGQHLVMQSIVPLIEGHYAKNSPNKALVLSFHGMPGVGKNYVASMIAEHLYEGGMTSKFVRLFIGGVHFPIPEEFENYKQQIKTWIVERVTACELSLFIIDELDMMDGRVLEAIKPFIDYHQHIDGVNFRRSIFIFLSNMASYEITNKTFEHFRLGKPRDTISLSEMNEIIKQTSYANEGGLQFSKLIKHQLIDHFIPFLPLEREHTMQCIRWHFKLKNYEMTEERVKYALHPVAVFQQHFFLHFAAHQNKCIPSTIPQFVNVPQLRHGDFGLDETPKKEGARRKVGRSRQSRHSRRFTSHTAFSKIFMAPIALIPYKMVRDIPELKDRIRNAFGLVSDEVQEKMLLEHRDMLERVLKNDGGHIDLYNL